METIEIVVNRTIYAVADDIYDAWLDLETPGGLWFGVERVVMNGEVDGLFYHSVAHGGKSWAHYGRFLRLDRGRVIEYTWMSEGTRGLESIVTVTFEPVSDGTLVTLRQVNVPDDEAGRGHRDAWAWYLEVLAQRFDAAEAVD